MRRLTGGVALMVLVLTLMACGAGMLLESPVSSGCEEAGLKGCPMLTEGVLLVADGDKPAGIQKIKAGAGENAPDELLKFAVALKAIGSIPGAAQYMGPVLEVCAILEDVAKARKAEAASAEPGTAGGESALASAPGTPSRAGNVTADTDAKQIVTATFTITETNRELCDPQEPFGAMCGRAAEGPLVLTDLIVSEGCAAVGAAIPDISHAEKRPVWRFRGSESRHGMRLLIARGHHLVLGAGEDPACQLMWSGFRPYE